MGNWTRLAIAVVVSLLSASWLFAEPVAFDENNPFVGHRFGSLNYYTPGIIRPEQGTVEMIIQPSRPSTSFGSDWDFPFKIDPGQPVGGNTLFGLLFPNLEFGQKGVRLVNRSQGEYGNLHYPDIEFAADQKVLLSFSWGSQLRLYVNGKRVAAQDYQTPIGPMNAAFNVQQFSPFHTQSIRISTVQLADNQLASDPNAELKATADTALLATDRINKVQVFKTPWHQTSGYAMAMPAWLPHTQCFVQGDSPTYPIVTVNYGSAAKTITIRQTALDSDGKTIYTKDFPLTLAAHQPHRVEYLAMPGIGSTVGLYQIRTSVDLGQDAKAMEYISSVSVAPANDANVPDGKLRDYLGYHHNFSYDASLVQQLGIRWVRLWGVEPFLWFNAEPVQGRFVWDRADDLVAQAKKYDLHPLGLMGNPPRWAAVEPPAEMKAKHPLAQVPARWKPRDVQQWSKYIFSVIDRYKNDIKHWEIYNEVDFHPPGMPASFSGTTAEYYELLKNAYIQAKKADPSSKVLISGFSLTDAVCDPKMPFDLLNMGAADYFDIFNMHAYNVLMKVDDLKKAVAAKKANVPFWQTEQMWHTITHQEQRLFLTPAIYLWFMDKGFDKFFAFGFYDVYFNRPTLSPTADHLTLAAFQNQIRKGEKYIGQLRFDGDQAFSVRHQIKRTDGNVLTVLGAERMTYRLESSNEIMEIRDILGRPVEIKKQGDTWALSVPTITYVISREPLKIVKCQETAAAALIDNGSFEQVQGDITMGGLKAGKPTNWVYRDTTYDKQGSIGLTNDAHTGKLAVRVHSSGAGRVYLFHDTKIPAPGTYQLTAWLKKDAAASNVTPTLSVYDRDANKVHTKKLTDVTGTYAAYSMLVTFDKKPDRQIALIVGIDGGQGDLLVDDMDFAKYQETKIPSEKAFHIDLQSHGNTSIQSEIKATYGAIALSTFTSLGQGITRIDGVPFAIPDKNGKCSVVGDDQWPSLSRQANGMPVNQKLNAIAFLQTAMYVQGKPGDVMGKYVIHYANGSKAEVPIRCEMDIRDWYLPAHKKLPDAALPVKVMLDAKRSELVVFNQVWKNPNPTVAIASIDLLSQSGGIICLIAATGEKNP